jgi:hypothetical protein
MSMPFSIAFFTERFPLRCMVAVIKPGDSPGSIESGDLVGEWIVVGLWPIHGALCQLLLGFASSASFAYSIEFSFLTSCMFVPSGNSNSCD